MRSVMTQVCGEKYLRIVESECLSVECTREGVMDAPCGGKDTRGSSWRCELVKELDAFTTR